VLGDEVGQLDAAGSTGRHRAMAAHPEVARPE